MTKEEFLFNSDVHVLDYEITETLDCSDKKDVEVLLIVGQSDNEIEELVEKNGEDAQQFIFGQMEIILSEESLLHLLEEVRSNKEHLKKFGHLKEEWEDSHKLSDL